MKYSKRITAITGDGDDGWGVFYRARQMIAAGKPITELTIGEHDIGTHQSILNAMHDAASGGHTGYAVVPGSDALRAIVAKRIMERTGVPTGPQNIMITPGGQAGLFAAHHALCDAGDRALFIDPYYATYPTTIRAVGATPVAIKTTAQNGFQPRAEDLGPLAKGAKTLLINSPNNPTGVVYDRTTLEGIAEVCQTHDITLISDEVYDTQVWEGAHISPRTLPDMADRTVVIGSMSKSHAMTGSRVGWVCAPAPMIELLIDLATTTTYGVPGYIQDAAAYALAQGKALEQDIAAPFDRRRKATMALLAGQSVVKASPAQGAMYVMLDIRATGLSGIEFANRLLDDEGIAVMPGESFGQAAGGHIRIAMTIDDDAYNAALERLIAFATQLTM